MTRNRSIFSTLSACALAATLLFVALLSGCSGAAGTANNTSSSVSIAVSPSTAALQVGGTVQLTASVSGSSNTNVTWTASGGSVSASGLYTAPSTAGTYTVTATSAADNTKTAAATITVTTTAPVVAVTVAPTSAALQISTSQQFTATVTGSSNTSVTWAATGGTVTSAGLYTAPATAGTYTVKATSVADTTKSASANVTVTVTPPPVSVTISPTSASLQTGATKQFTATVTGSSNTSVTWTATGGSVSSTGLYTAPSAAGSYTVKATSVADTTKSASATVAVTAIAPVVSVAVSPVSAALQVSTSQQFTATVTGTTNTGVTWTASGGTISSTGLYTAPSAAGSYTVTATSSADSTKTASATVNVTTGPPATADADFAARCAASGVVECIGFDSQSDLTNKIFVSSDGTGVTPVIDTGVSASGGGSLKCSVNPNTFGTDPCGSFHTRFKDDNSVVIGQGQEFYIQWRQRFQDSYYIHHDWSQGHESDGTNWKQAIISLQDQNSCNLASPIYGNGWGASQDGSPCATSCSDLEVVPRNSIGTEGFIYGYHSCGNWENWEPGSFSDQYSSGDFMYQGTRQCLYSDPSGSNASNCFTYQYGQWMTFQVHVKINQWNNNNNVLEIWGAYEGQPSVLVHSMQDFYLYNDCATGSEASCGGQPKKYGNVWLTSYMTAHVAESGQPTTATWWDELVVSTKRVADPMVNTPQPPSVLTTSGTGSGSVSIAWQSNSSGSESGFLIERCESDSYSCHARVNSAPAWHQIASVGAGVTSYTDTTLTHGEVATYRVRAYNGSGNSGYAGAVCLDPSHYASHQCPGTGAAQ